jgi:hypothetical protein
MRRHLPISTSAALLIALAVVWTAHATTTVPDVVRCPVDGTSLDVLVPAATNAMGGTDSDFCQYAAGGQAREHAVATCSTCFYSAHIGSFERELTPEHKTALLEMLGQAHAPGQDAASLDPWDRYQLAALCAGVLEVDALDRGDILLSGAWTVRDRVVGFIPTMDGPLDMKVKLDDYEAAWNEIPDLRTQQMGLFDLMRLAHRGGFMQRRDRYFALLDELQPVPAEMLEIRAKVRDLIEIENRFLDKALQHYEQGIAASEGSAADRAYYSYLVIDLKRRLGRNEGLWQAMMTLLADEDLPEHIRPMARGLKETMRDLR